MTAEQKQAYEWAKNQSYQSVAARYAKELCRVIEALQSENGEKDKDISRVEAERDAANGYLEKIDGMFGTAYPNEILAVLEEWRGAQGEA